MCCSPNREAVRDVDATHYHMRALQTLIYGILTFAKPASRKRLRAKNTPDLHLTYSKTRGSVGFK